MSVSRSARGALVLVGTPIGNLADCSERTREVLERADLIVAEDTRRLRKLLSHLQVAPKRFVSYHPGNFERRNREILDAIMGGALVAFTTDAGMPLISDPGAELVAQALAQGVDVDCVPGPSAVLQALVLSGFPASRFVFEGFLPRSSSRRRKFFEEIVHESRPVVVFESPHRLLKALCDAREVMGPGRKVAVCRELTKMHQEVLRTDLDGAVAHFSQHKPRGEFVLVFGPGADSAGESVSAGSGAEAAVRGDQ